MQALSAHARKACSGKFTCIKQLLGHKHTHVGHQRAQSADAEQCRHASTATVAASVGRKRRWPRRLAFTALGSAGLGLAVASGGDTAHARAILAALPRTGNAILWVARSSVEYSRCVAAHPSKAGTDYEAALEMAHQQCADRLLKLCQTNGSLYVKAAQFATTIPSVPAPYRRTLEVLQDQVTPQPFEDINEVLLREFGADAHELFAEFEQQATAAASLAQVHKAQLLSGEEVAVKVQYAGLASAVAADLATFAGLAVMAGIAFPDFKLGWVVADLRQQLAKELDFRLEADNSRTLAAATADDPAIAVPAVYDELSNERIITMEWVQGAKVSDKAAMEALNLRPKEVGTLLMRVFADMAFQRGCVHADPHPGNVLARPHPVESQSWLSRWLRGGRSVAPQIVLLDHGTYIHLPEQLRQQYCQLWCAFVLNDTTAARQVSHAIGGKRVAALLPLLLKPGALGRMPKKQRERIRQETGLQNLGDVQKLIELMPRPLAQYLRVSAIVRNTAANLGCTIHDRLRVNATAALRGMSVQHSNGQAQYIGDLQSRSRRLNLWVRISLLRWLAWSTDWWQLLTSRWQAAPG